MARVGPPERRGRSTSKASETPPSSQKHKPPDTSRAESSPQANASIKNDDPLLDEMSIPCCGPFEPLVCHRLVTAIALPPVTKATLSELDLNWIMHNVSLRVDVNYDHDLHFMPIRGPGGDKKRKDAQDYWLALAAELQIYQHDLSACHECSGNTGVSRNHFKQRLPAMFRALKELLETLVPDRDHPDIVQNLDIPFLMQQIRNGVLDIARLSLWVAELLKSHCAPMRDEWADAMATKIKDGVNDSDMIKLVQGLETLFSFLEAMKLDVANHQIRTFRYPLIEDTVSFQQNHFSKKIQEDKIKTESSLRWFQHATEEHGKCEAFFKQNVRTRPVGALIHGILARCTRQCTQRKKDDPLPVTLTYDRGRMEKLEDDIQDRIHLRICLIVFDKFIHKISRRKIPLTSIPQTLVRDFMDVVGKDSTRSRAEMWQIHIEEVAMQITHDAFVACGPGPYQIPDEHFAETSRYLHERFGREFDSVAGQVRAELEQMTCEQAAIFHEKTALQMSEDQKQWDQSRNDLRLSRVDLQDIARRVAHMSVLHWRIWGGLVYLRDERDEIADGVITNDGEMRASHPHTGPSLAREQDGEDVRMNSESLPAQLMPP